MKKLRTPKEIISSRTVRDPSTVFFTLDEVINCIEIAQREALETAAAENVEVAKKLIIYKLKRSINYSTMSPEEIFRYEESINTKASFLLTQFKNYNINEKQ